MTREGLEDFSDIRNQLVVNKIENYLADENTPDDVEVIYGNNHQLRENIDEQGPEAFGYKSMGFYMVSDWVPAYGYGLAAEENSDIFPVSEADVQEGYGVYSTDSDYYTPEAEGWKPDDFYTYDEYHLSGRSNRHMATYLLNSDITTEEGTFEKIYNGPKSDFAAAIEDDRIPSNFSTVYTFGDSSIDIGRGLEVTTQLVENRDSGKPKEASYIIKSGDSLWGIVREQYSTEDDAQTLSIVQAVVEENNILHPDSVHAGQELKLPDADVPEK